MKNGEKSVAAGIFISKSEIKKLGQVHKKIFDETIPFSWFFIQHYLERSLNHHSSNLVEGKTSLSEDTKIKIDPKSTGIKHNPDTDSKQWAHGIVKGQKKSIDKLLKATGEENIEFGAVPKHTISIDISIGSDLGPENMINPDL